MFRGYSVDGQIGAGATGVVWLATQDAVGRKVAIKQLAPALADDAAFRAQFRAEARTLASITHENIVAVYDYVEEGDSAPYLVEEWVDGASLDRVIESAGRLSVEQAVGVLRGALTGLAVAHDSGVVHGDVTPRNILVDREGTSKLIDFGLSTSAGERASGATVAYASPEAQRGDPVDARSDVYAAGSVLFELLSGKPPYAGSSPDAVRASHLDAPVPNLPGAPAAIAGVVERALAKDPSARYPDAREFLRALEESSDADLGTGWFDRASIAAFAVAASAKGAGAVGASTASSASVHTTAVTRESRIGKFVAKHKLAVGIGATATAAAVTVGVIAASGGSTAKPLTAGKVDLVLAGSHNMHLVGTKVGACDADSANILGSDYPELGSDGAISIVRGAGIKSIIEGKGGGSPSAGGISSNGEPPTITVTADIQGNGNELTHVSGTVTCPEKPKAAAAAGNGPVQAVVVWAPPNAGLPQVLNTTTFQGKTTQQPNSGGEALTFGCARTGCQFSYYKASQPVNGDDIHLNYTHDAAGNCPPSQSVVALHITGWTQYRGIRIPTGVGGSIDSTAPETANCEGSHWRNEGTVPLQVATTR